MGRRGPKPTDGYPDKTQVLSTRITPELKVALQEAAAAKGRKLGTEVEYRLRRSFDEDRIISDHLGGPQLHAILRTIAAIMDMAGRQAFFSGKRKLGSAADWLNDPYAYDQAVKATITVLERLRPEGDASPRVMRAADETAEEAVQRTNYFFANMGESFARSMVDDIAKAEPTLPTPRTTRRQEALARRIASELGTVRDRLKGGKK